jgi:pimeloyl-ACP methyl ester carboxylesterase
VNVVRNGDVQIAYDVKGEGEPLLMIQGLGYDRFGWGRLPDLLAQDFRVLVFDNRGVGDSDVPDGPYSISQMAEDGIAVLDDAGADSAHVLGVSLGGFIAQELVLSHPDRVRKLVLVSTAPGGPKMVPMPAKGVEAFGRFPTMEREAGFRMMVENSLGAYGVREQPELVEEIYRYRLERGPTVAGWTAQAYAGATFDGYDRIPAITHETLVLQGGADDVVDPRNADLLVELIPNARLELIPDRGHLIVWQESERLAAVVREFLRS